MGIGVRLHGERPGPVSALPACLSGDLTGIWDTQPAAVLAPDSPASANPAASLMLVGDWMKPRRRRYATLPRSACPTCTARSFRARSGSKRSCCSHARGRHNRFRVRRTFRRQPRAAPTLVTPARCVGVGSVRPSRSLLRRERRVRTPRRPSLRVGSWRRRARRRPAARRRGLRARTPRRRRRGRCGCRS